MAGQFRVVFEWTFRSSIICPADNPLDADTKCRQMIHKKTSLMILPENDDQIRINRLYLFPKIQGRCPVPLNFIRIGIIRNNIHQRAM